MQNLILSIGGLYAESSSRVDFYDGWELALQNIGYVAFLAFAVLSILVVINFFSPYKGKNQE